MSILSILNHVQKFKGFVFKKVQWANPQKTEIDVLVEAVIVKQSVAHFLRFDSWKSALLSRLSLRVKKDRFNGAPVSGIS